VQPFAVRATAPPLTGSDAGVAVSDVQLGAPGAGVPESHVTVTLPLPSDVAVKLAQALLVIVTLAAIAGAATPYMFAANTKMISTGVNLVRTMSNVLKCGAEELPRSTLL
jgi:hypothetical protein